MKRRRGEKEKWEDFEARVGIKRSGGGKKETHKAAPNDILVQCMSSTASGRLKKFEPVDNRDFVPFGDYDDLTIENIKEACEKYSQAPEGSCDIAACNRQLLISLNFGYCISLDLVPNDHLPYIPYLRT